MSPRREFDLFRRGLNQRRFSEADIEWMRYIGPLGSRGVHKVRPMGSTKPIRVSGPRRTWRPGELVPVGSHTGTQGRMILQANAAQRGTPFPLVTQSTQPVAPVVSPKDPLEIFGGSLVVWYDIFEQGTSEGDGNPVTTFTDFSGNGNHGTGQGSPILVLSGPNGLPVWRFNTSQHLSTGGITVGPTLTGFSFYAVLSVSGTTGSAVFSNSTGTRYIRRNGTSLNLQADMGVGAFTGTLTYSAGTITSLGFTRLSNFDHLWQNGASEETNTAAEGDQVIVFDVLLRRGSFNYGGDVQMVVGSNLPANATQRAEMVTYMEFIRNGGWA